MSSGNGSTANLEFRPLTFLQTRAAMRSVAPALIARGAPAQHWLTVRGGQSLGSSVALPLYYHYATSGFGAVLDETFVGWLFLRGWYQVLYIDMLATHSPVPDDAVEVALLAFAEEQAQLLRRRWLGLTASTDERTLDAYHAWGFAGEHCQFMRGPLSALLSLSESPDARLVPLVGFGINREHYRLAVADWRAKDVEDEFLARYLSSDPYLQPGFHFALRHEGHLVAYLNVHTSADSPTAYCAAQPDFWGNPALLAAAGRALARVAGPDDTVSLRLGSVAHHEAACPALEALGFAERPAKVTRLYKKIN